MGKITTYYTVFLYLIKGFIAVTRDYIGCWQHVRFQNPLDGQVHNPHILIEISVQQMSNISFPGERLSPDQSPCFLFVDMVYPTRFVNTSSCFNSRFYTSFDASTVDTFSSFSRTVAVSSPSKARSHKGQISALAELMFYPENIRISCIL